MIQILKDTKNSLFNGCDFVLQLGEERKNTKIKLLQITDMQFDICHIPTLTPYNPFDY